MEDALRASRLFREEREEARRRVEGLEEERGVLLRQLDTARAEVERLRTADAQRGTERGGAPGAAGPGGGEVGLPETSQAVAVGATASQPGVPAQCAWEVETGLGPTQVG